MSMATRTDHELLELLGAAQIHTIADVITTMRAIDALLPSEDGLKWFNALYLMVTCSVAERSDEGSWHDIAWLNRLDVVFAQFYFDAIKSTAEADRSIAKSWDALFESRQRSGIDRIQFALAGMNAHINHDLPLALIKTDEEKGIQLHCGSRQYADYQAVNALLEVVMPSSLTMLATGVLGQLAQDTGKVGQMLAIWNVRVARDLAWDFATHLSTLDEFGHRGALAVQDRMTGALGRSLLQRL
jgi:hypothetical protein